MDCLFSLQYKVLKCLSNNTKLLSTKKETMDFLISCFPEQKSKLADSLIVLESKGYIMMIRTKGYIVTDKGKNTVSVFENAVSELDEKPLTFIDLFAGIGGIRKGFEDIHTKCVFSCEWDKYAQKTYEANFGEIPAGDITAIKEQDIPQHDVVLAGFPCQPFSMIGKREGIDDEKGRGTLFFDVLRIIKYHKPKMLLLENVPGLLTIQKGETFKMIISLLENEGYDITWGVLDSANFGLAQSRKRVLIVGFRKDLMIGDFHLPLSNGETTKYACDILEDNPTGYSISKHLQETYLFKKDDGHPQIIDKDSKVLCKTLVASYHKIQRITGTFVRGGETGIRLLSELECKRLMGYPDNFIFPVSRTQMYHQLGNSVTVPVIKAVADEMKRAYRKTNQF